MKILFDFQNMIGGAPRTQLTHMQTMKEAGHEVVATIGRDADVLRRLSGGIRIITVREFLLDKPFRNLVLIKQWLKILESEKPDVIHANRTNQYRFLGVVSDLTGIPLVFAQAGGVALPTDLRPLLGKTPVGYSLENKKTFVSAGFEAQTVHVISNRMHSLNDSAASHRELGKSISILLTGNIKGSTVNGMMKLLRNLASIGHAHRRFRLLIAGQDITPNKNFDRQVAKQIALTNKSLIRDGFVEHLGWVDDIGPIQASSDICIGKGRSVIQPAMAGKVCFVLAESGRLTRVSLATFDSLYEYNFSGRGDQRDDSAEFFALFTEGSIWRKAYQEAKDVQSKVREYYLAEGAKDKLLAAYNDALYTQEKEPSLRKSVNRFARIYIEWIRFKVSRSEE